ncbi:alpha-amylase family glycosyl hydrolase, partial [Arsenicibacter rosenii]|uniref:alpha-amylase family glycosyl hydrolase n=1 Tax=Arsenicibacter rosenii TaxID=1750698 RepID=UPI000A4294A5
IAAMLLLTLRGTPTIYYGEEICMRDVAIPFEEVQDPQGLNMPDKNLSRDPARTPMQWNDSVNAGFSDVKPWLRVARNYSRENVAVQENDPYSLLTLYRRLIRLRQNEPALMTGDYTPIYADRQAIAYLRGAEGADRFLIVLNLSHRPAYLKLNDDLAGGTIVLASYPELEGAEVSGNINLNGDEGIIVRLKSTQAL